MDNGSDKNKSDVFLSICIPTYNRIEKTLKLIESILKYEKDDIEVVVLDNCSTDSTFSLLSNIQDKRFNYIRNHENIGGMPNILKSLTYGRGTYVMLCLDKDFLLSENIEKFIYRLKEKDVAVGHCSLNSSDYSKDIIYHKGSESILNIAYTSEHPSGMFIKNCILKSKPIIDSIINKYKTFAFLPELVKAEVAHFGRSARINMPFVYTETKEDCGKEISHTYKGDNIYFMPKNIIDRFLVYIDHVYSHNLTANDKKNVTAKIYRTLLCSSVFDYKQIMLDKEICNHHGIMTKKIKKKELISNVWKFNKFFFNSNFLESFLWKFKIAFFINVKLIVKIIIN